MRNEIALDLAGFSGMGNGIITGGRAVQGNRSMPGSRTVQGNRNMPGSRAVQGNRSMPGSRVVQGNRSMAESRTVQAGKAMPASKAMHASQAMHADKRMQANRTEVGRERAARSRAMTVSRPVQSRREAEMARERRLAQQRLREYRRRKRFARRCMILAGLFGVAGISLVVLFKSAFPKNDDKNTIGGVLVQEGAFNNVQNVTTHPAWTENFLTVNEYSRPGTPLTEVHDIFVHYTANPNTNAVQNRSYFEQLKDTHERGASAHFIIGYEGDILQCIPLNEVAYAVKTRNEDSISIECCYQNEDGSFNQATYDSLIELLAWLVQEYDLTTDNILRHYDCGGKKCPLYYTEHEDAWEQLKRDVADALLDL